jgi:hypothetical protein
MPKPGSGAGISAISYVKPITLMLYGGGEAIKDTREIRGLSLNSVFIKRGEKTP